MKSPIAKVALDAMTDQSIAEIRGERRKIAEDGADKVTVALLDVSARVAAVLAEQFPASRETAARAVICAVQCAAKVGDTLRELDLGVDPLDAVTDVLAYAAEQVIREGGTP
jgi:hypothetical protein